MSRTTLPAVTLTDPWASLVVTVESHGGFVPVQTFGTIARPVPFDPDGRSWYFRARGERWSLTIGQSDGGDYVSADGADLDIHGPADDPQPYRAGYMDDTEALRHIAGGLTLWAAGIRGVAMHPDHPDWMPSCMECGAQSSFVRPEHPRLRWCERHAGPTGVRIQRWAR